MTLAPPCTRILQSPLTFLHFQCIFNSPTSLASLTPPTSLAPTIIIDLGITPSPQIGVHNWGTKYGVQNWGPKLGSLNRVPNQGHPIAPNWGTIMEVKMGVLIGGPYWGSILKVPKVGPYWGSKMEVQNGVPYWGLYWGSILGVHIALGRITPLITPPPPLIIPLITPQITPQITPLITPKSPP
jgi:hypothetical protein